VAALVGPFGHIVDDSRPSRFDMVEFAREQPAASTTLRHLFTVGSERSSEHPDAEPIEVLGLSIDPQVARRAVDAAQAGLGPEDVAVYQLSGGTSGVPKVIPRLHCERRPVLDHRPAGQAPPRRDREDRPGRVAADPVLAEHTGGLRR